MESTKSCPVHPAMERDKRYSGRGLSFKRFRNIHILQSTLSISLNFTTFNAVSTFNNEVTPHPEDVI